MRQIAAAFLAMLAAAPALADISGGVVRIGVLTDMSGVYSDLTGKGAVAAARMAIDDCIRAECRDLKVELLSADHQNKVDVGSTRAREWIDTGGVDVLVDMSNAALQLAIPPLLREKNRLGLFMGGTARLTGDACEPGHIVQWMWDTYGQVAGVAGRLTTPGTSWYIVAVDYALGHQFEADARATVERRGGRVLGAVRHPFPGTDFSSFMLQAQASGADYVALANAGGDTINALKSAREFGMIGGKQKLVGFLLTNRDIESVGLDVAQGTTVAEAYYADLDEGTRRFAERFRAEMGRSPSVIQAGIYSATLHYLKAVAASGSDDVGTVLPRMRAMPIADDVVRNARLREDGRMLHDLYILEAKRPAESRGPGDIYRLVATVPGEEAFRPISPACPRRPG